MAMSLDMIDEIHFFEIGNWNKQKKWKQKHKWTIKEHHKPISVVDWSKRNKLLTASHDRNIHVWELDAEKDCWTKVFVMVGFARGSLENVSFSPRKHASVQVALVWGVGYARGEVRGRERELGWRDCVYWGEVDRCDGDG